MKLLPGMQTSYLFFHITPPFLRTSKTPIAVKSKAVPPEDKHTKQEKSEAMLSALSVCSVRNALKNFCCRITEVNSSKQFEKV